MKKEKTPLWQEIIKPTLSLCLILVITVGILAVARHFTASGTETGDYRFELSVYQSVYADVQTPEARAELTDGSEVLEVLDAGQGRYLITVAEKGYSATKIEVVVGISQPNTADGIAFGICDETQGLGANIQKEKFLNRFLAKEGPFALGQNADGLAGATYSSKAFVAALNKAFATYDEIIKGAES